MLGDIMYYNQTLQQPVAKQFANAVLKEVNGHVDNNHWKLIKQEDVPNDAQVVPSFWSMHCKRDLTMNKVTNHKARLNLHGRVPRYQDCYWKLQGPCTQAQATQEPLWSEAS